MNLTIHNVTLDTQRAIVPRIITPEELTAAMETLLWIQRSLNFWLGDVGHEALSRGGLFSQVFPEGRPCNQVQRCVAVAEQYRVCERVEGCTWSQHQRVANKSDREHWLKLAVKMGWSSDQLHKEVRARC